jgi:hypothetical protein
MDADERPWAQILPIALDHATAAAVLGLTREALLRLVMCDAIPHLVVGGETIYPREALETWIDLHTLWPDDEVTAVDPDEEDKDVQ